MRASESTGVFAPNTPLLAHRDPVVQLLLDRRAIEDLLHAYAAGVDRRDFDLVAACFAPDVHGPFGGTERHDRDELIAYISGVRFFHTTMHMMGNTLIEVDGDAARLDSDAMVTHRGTTEAGDEVRLDMSGSHYRERLARREEQRGPGGAWCIVERALATGSALASLFGARVGATAGARVGASVSRAQIVSADPAVRWLLDRTEIHDLLTRYAVGVDARSYAPVRACFARTFRANYLGHEFDDIDALEQFIRGVEHFGWTRHFLSRPALDLRGDTASSDVPAILSSRRADDPKGRRERTTAARYRDELVREHGLWRVIDRRHGVESPPVDRSRQNPRSSDPAIAYLIDRALIEDCVVAFAGAIDRAEHAHHFVGNQRVRLDASGADVETYVYRLDAIPGTNRHTAWQEKPQRWEDRLVCDDGEWRVAEHRVCSNRVAPGAVRAAADPDR